MKRSFSVVLLSAAFVAFSLHGMGQTPRATAHIDSTRILIGDQVKLKLEVEMPKSAKIEFPSIGDTLTTGIEVVKRSPLDTFKLSAADQVKLVQELTITSFDTGLQTVPKFKFLLKSGASVDSVFTSPISMQVLGMRIDTTKGPVDIKKPYAAPITLKEVSPYILGIILIGAIVFFVFYYLNRRKKNMPLFAKAEKPKEPAHVTALRELDRIRDEKIWQQEKIKEYYSQVTDALRTYIQDRFSIPAMELTSEETLSLFRQQKNLVPDKSFEQLTQILQLADLVKFAKYYPLPDDNNLSLINAYFFVNQTKVEEVAKPESAAEEREGEDVNIN